MFPFSRPQSNVLYLKPLDTSKLQEGYCAKLLQAEDEGPLNSAPVLSPQEEMQNFTPAHS